MFLQMADADETNERRRSQPVWVFASAQAPSDEKHYENTQIFGTVASEHLTVRWCRY